MKRNQIILPIMLCLLPIIFGLILWNDLPDQIPIHFNASDQPDNYAQKALAIFGLPMFMAVVDAVAIFSMKKDPKAINHTKLMVGLGAWVCPVICNIIMPISFFSALGKKIPVGTITSILIGLIIVVVGNYLPKCKQNYTIGIKLPWTLNDEDNWNYTHRITGFVWVIGGICMIITSFLKIPYIMIVWIVFIAVIPFITSFRFYLRKEKKKRI